MIEETKTKTAAIGSTGVRWTEMHRAAAPILPSRPAFIVSYTSKT